ncbi:MAG: polysaccharide deacetylase family protein [Pseudomonadota bacterium]
MYHRFSEDPAARTVCAKTFATHLDQIERRFDVMSLSAFYRVWREQGEPPANAAVITVDDGYLDFADIAWPMLEARGLPATLFVSTRFADGDFWLWPDKLEYALFTSEAMELRLEERRFPLADVAQRWQCFDALCAWFTRIDDEQKHRLIKMMLDDLAVTMPDQPTADFQAIGWQQLRALADAGVDIGGHTRTHPVLSRLETTALDEEIAGCKTEIEARIGRDIHTFCYPNGQPEDINQAVRDAVQRAGFDCAVSAYFRHDVLADRFEIKRYSASEHVEQFQKNLDGVEYLSSVLNQRFGI